MYQSMKLLMVGHVIDITESSQRCRSYYYQTAYGFKTVAMLYLIVNASRSLVGRWRITTLSIVVLKNWCNQTMQEQ